MYSKNHSIRKITRALNISRNTVRKYVREIDLESTALIGSSKTAVPKQIDWEFAAAERSKGRPIKRIFEELGPNLSYSTFTRKLNQQSPKKPIIAIKLNHEPGEKAQIDYGEGLNLYERLSGSEISTQFFCGVLPFSSYVFGEFTASQKLPDFIRSHERMWSYFGGMSKYVVLDNLKSGVSRAHRYDPELNPTYCDFANHCGFAALPARVRTPRDKACVEATIGLIQRDFFDRQRNTKFYSLEELNSCFRLYLDDLNSRTMADYGCSRILRFQEERKFLLPINAEPYEMYEWKTAKVHPDSCIELKRSVYSVPSLHVHKQVQVKFSDKMVIILDDLGSTTLAVHPRMPRFKNSINEAHLPPAKVQMGTFDVMRIEKIAANIGIKTKEYVDWQFSSDLYPLRALRRMQGLLRYYERDKNSKEAMEFAATKSIQFQKKHLRFFEGCINNYNSTGGKLHLVNPPKREMANIHLQNKDHS
jgi:transposase